MATISLTEGSLLNVDQAARLLNVKPSTIRAWLTQGRLPRTKVGGRTMVLRSDCERLVEQGRRSQ